MPIWLGLSVTTFVLWGTWGFFAKVASDSIDSRSAAILQGLGAFAVTIVLLASQRFRVDLHLGGSTAAVLGGLALMAGIITFSAALGNGGRASIVVPLSMHMRRATVTETGMGRTGSLGLDRCWSSSKARSAALSWGPRARSGDETYDYAE